MTNLLLDPNIVFCSLVLGILLTILALFTPGTGLLELGALFVLIVAGWGVYNNPLPINPWAIAILIVGVAIGGIPFIAKMKKSNRPVFLIIALAAFALGSMYLFEASAWWKPAVSPLVAVPVSIVTGGILWIIAHKAIEAEQLRPSHDLRKLIGQVGEAKTDIHTEGSVQVDGELWSAWSEQPITAGAVVRVIGREELILKVEKA
jgi:membrane-bound serine protease (ClpP class)